MVDQSVDETIWRDLKEQIWFKLHGAERLQQPVVASRDWYRNEAFGLIMSAQRSPNCGARKNRKPQCQLRSTVAIKE